MTSIAKIQRKPLFLALSLLSFLACGTLAGDPDTNVNLPTAGGGPFRFLKRRSCNEGVCVGVEELPPGAPDGSPKYLGVSNPHSPSVLVRSRSNTQFNVIMYITREPQEGSKFNRITRMESFDARSFSDDVTDVLRADQPWESGGIDDPWAIDVEIEPNKPEIWLFYTVKADAANSNSKPGIARARSTDGLNFIKDPGPILTLEKSNSTWETTPPRAPSVVLASGGIFHLFYTSGNSIGEAISTDGFSFTRVGGAQSQPILTPRPQTSSSSSETSTSPSALVPPFDDASVDDPCVDRVITPAGQVLYRLLYTGRSQNNGMAIGFAGRFGDSGTFERNPEAVFKGKEQPSAPAVARFDTFSLLYTNEQVNTDYSLNIAIAPIERTLPLSK